jgi:hypothetical protein
MGQPQQLAEWIERRNTPYGLYTRLNSHASGKRSVRLRCGPSCTVKFISRRNRKRRTAPLAQRLSSALYGLELRPEVFEGSEATGAVRDLPRRPEPASLTTQLFCRRS